MPHSGVNLAAPWGIALLRVVTGAIFLMHGQQKLFEFGIGGVTGMMTGLGVPAPGLMALVVTFVELLGGIALILGAFTRIAAVLVAIDVLVAFFLVHLPNGFFATNGGVELVLLGEVEHQEHTLCVAFVSVHVVHAHHHRRGGAERFVAAGPKSDRSKSTSTLIAAGGSATNPAKA